MTEQDLKSFLTEHVSRPDFAALYIEYSERLIKENLPVIFEIDHLSALVGLEVATIAKMSMSTESYYRTFDIPKRRGSRRTIAAPLPSLLHVQKWVLKNIVHTIPTNNAAHGFIVGRSILTNAQKHVGKRALLKCDIKDFFPSIHIGRVVAQFKALGYSPTVSVLLARLCTLNGCLPQGAATSPGLSNLTVRHMDKRLSALASTAGLTYTRYADDLSFSGDHIPLAFKDTVGLTVADEGFVLNHAKTQLICGEGRKIVTGISVNGPVPRLPKCSKRELRREVHLLLANGIVEQSYRQGVFDPLYVDRVFGKLQFWKHVEPDNPFVNRTIGLIAGMQSQSYAIATEGGEPPSASPI